MLDDLINYLRTNEANRKADDAQFRAMQTNHRVEDVATELKNLTRRMRAIETAVETLIRLNVQAGHFTQDEFLETARQVENGGVLGQVSRAVSDARTCPSCGRVSPPERTRCMWCDVDFGGGTGGVTGPGDIFLK